jgi:hypothetical protein
LDDRRPDASLPSPASLMQLIRTRRSIRHYRPDPVPAKVLHVPADRDVVGLPAVGCPDETPLPTERKPLADVPHYGVFDSRSPLASPGAGRRPGGVWSTVWRHLSPRIGRRRGRQEAE